MQRGILLVARRGCFADCEQQFCKLIHNRRRDWRSLQVVLVMGYELLSVVVLQVNNICFGCLMNRTRTTLELLHAHSPFYLCMCCLFAATHVGENSHLLGNFSSMPDCFELKSSFLTFCAVTSASQQWQVNWGCPCFLVQVITGVLSATHVQRRAPQNFAEHIPLFWQWIPGTTLSIVLHPVLCSVCSKGFHVNQVYEKSKSVMRMSCAML